LTPRKLSKKISLNFNAPETGTNHQGDRVMIRKLFIVFAVLAMALFTGQASAATIYSEEFTTDSTTSVSTFNWTGHEDDGTNLTASTADPMYVTSTDYVQIGSGGSNTGGAYAAISNAPAIDPTAYANDLTISFSQSATDDGSDDAGKMGWRALVKVGSTWYASDLQSFSSSPEARSVIVSNPIWHSWETDLTDGFDISGISGIAATLPVGDIVSTGVLAVDGDNGNDRMQLRSYEITGTIPEPSK
jgi:hypothetical protein